MKPLTRRHFLSLTGGAGAAVALGACGTSSATPRAVGPQAPVVAAVDGRRYRNGITKALALNAAPLTVDLAGQQVPTWAYATELAAPEIRVTKGTQLAVTLRNALPEPTTVHWHGIAIRNNADGVPGLTQAAVQPGAEYLYRFDTPNPGTYFFHPHVGLQLDRGLYAPLVIEDPNEAGGDVDQVIVLDDWLDGVKGQTPDKALAALKARGGMMNRGSASQPSGMNAMGGMSDNSTAPTASGTGMSAMSSGALGGDAGDIAYPMYLLNGRPPADRPTINAAAGAKVRLRVINAGSDTAFRVAVEGHRLTVTHTDGWPVQPVSVDSFIVGMGERYDVELVARSGAWLLYAQAEGKTGHASAVLRTTDTTATSPPDVPPGGLAGQLLSYNALQPTEPARLAPRQPDRAFTVTLEGSMSGYRWSLGGDADRLDPRQGQRVRITLANRTMMWHPIHLHGHTFALSGYGGTRKDTVNVLPGRQVAIDVDTDNPGQWMLHCHNVYHQGTGMMTTFSYRT